MHRLLIPLISLVFSALSYADDIHFSSGENKVHLVELFSSQGCSSCPPAQRWVNQLEDSSALWKQVIPVVFHVDYWDYLGWKDPFSKAQFSFRQRAHKHQGNVKSVYTPGFVVNGEEWKGWFRGQGLKLTESSAGLLQFSLSKNHSRKRHFTASYAYQNADMQENLTLNVALLAMNHKTKVRAGENRFKELEESFIVLDLLRFEGSSNAKGHKDTRLNSEIRFSDSISPSRKVQAVAVWVSDKNSLHPIQSTGGYL